MWYICTGVRTVPGSDLFIPSPLAAEAEDDEQSSFGLGPSRSSLTTISIGTGILIDKNWNKVLHSLPRGTYRQFSCRLNEIRH